MAQMFLTRASPALDRTLGLRVKGDLIISSLEPCCSSADMFLSFKIIFKNVFISSGQYKFFMGLYSLI